MDLTKPQILVLLRARQREAWNNRALHMALSHCEFKLFGKTVFCTCPVAQDELLRFGLLVDRFHLTEAGRAWVDGLAASFTLFEGLRRNLSPLPMRST